MTGIMMIRKWLMQQPMDYSFQTILMVTSPDGTGIVNRTLGNGKATATLATRRITGLAFMVFTARNGTKLLTTLPTTSFVNRRETTGVKDRTQAVIRRTEAITVMIVSAGEVTLKIF